MQKEGRLLDRRRVRRYIGWVVFAAVLGIVGWILPRVLPRSPVTIVILCVLAVVVMKLVEHRIRTWFRRLDARRAAELRRTQPKP
jgi:peptidoglycan/LPS O-acetylase OafA/YrhL